jgi:hypothetical protein
MQRSYTFYRFYCDYVSGMFSLSDKVEDLFLCLGGMLDRYTVLSGYITTLKNKQKLDVSSEGPSSRVSSRDRGKCMGFYTKSMKASCDKHITN